MQQKLKAGSVINITSLPKTTTPHKYAHLIDTDQTVDNIEYGNFGGSPGITSLYIKNFPLSLNFNHYTVITY